jgi:hypothetical protein
MADFRISGASGNSRTECDIRLNYGDPSKIIAASNDFGSGVESMYFSTNGGATWNNSATNLPLTGADVAQSDPAVDWTSDGTAWALCIGIAGAPWRLRAYKSTDSGNNWALDATISGAQTATDREILWVDHSPTSPFKDQIYATWHNGTPVFFARRTAGAGGAWQPAIQLSGAETTVMGIGGDIKTNSFGDLYVFWPDADGSGNLIVTKSANGGQNFGAPVIIANVFASTRVLSIPADNGRGARVYLSGGAYRTATKDLVYAVWSDLTGVAGCNTGGGPGGNAASACKTRVWFSRSTNGGANWSAPVMINNQASLNDQFHSKLCVDESNGNIMVVYRDTVNDTNRLQADIWMQQSTDDGASWSTAVQVNSNPSDETVAGADPNQYGDYDGLTGFAGNFLPCWTDSRNGTPEEIWAAQLTLIQKRCFFIVDKSSYGQDEVQAMLMTGSGTVNNAFSVVIEGFTAAELGITAGDLVGPPGNNPTLTSMPAVVDMTIGQPTSLLAEDPSLPATPQRFTWFYPITFTSANGFTAPLINVTLNATKSTVNGSAQLQLVQQPNPYELDGATTWLSTDLRVFQIKEGESKFNANVGGDSPADAINFLTQVLTNLNPGGNSGGQTFEANLDANATNVALYQFDTDGTTGVFNFAIAKVRYQALVQDAQSVRVFFRLCPALTVALDYDGNDPTPATAHAVGNVYRRYTDGVQYGQATALIGRINNNILTIPCFATLRTSGDMTGFNDAPNVKTIVHNPSGAEVDYYFGCWLDTNQPGDTWYPLNPTNDGPFGGGLKSILELVRNQHQCLLAEIVFDPEPISNGATPGTSDKLAQRNLSLVASANPGDEASRRIPNTFELRPTPFTGFDQCDELMILWGNTPAGSEAQIYLPAVSADEIIEMARKKYISAKLTRVDDHTVACPSGSITYIPIPPGSNMNNPGLLTVSLPEGVKRGEHFNIVVRQFTRATAQQIPGFVEGASVSTSLDWKKIRGTFQVSIPVSTKAAMLEPEERLLSIMRWIIKSIPQSDRWYPVFRRYVDEIVDRVEGLGGDPNTILPSPTGDGKSKTDDTTCEKIKWLVPLIVAPVLVLIALAPLMLSAPVAAAGLVLLLAVVFFWYWHCKPSLCRLLCALIAGVSVAYLILGVIVLFGYRSLSAFLILALLGVLNGVLLIIAALLGCCRDCKEKKKGR